MSYANKHILKVSTNTLISCHLWLEVNQESRLIGIDSLNRIIYVSVLIEIYLLSGFFFNALDLSSSD